MYKELNSEAKRGGAEALFALAPLFACLMWWLFAILHFFLSFMFQCLVDLAIDQAIQEYDLPISSRLQSNTGWSRNRSSNSRIRSRNFKPFTVKHTSIRPFLLVDLAIDQAIQEYDLPISSRLQSNTGWSRNRSSNSRIRSRNFKPFTVKHTSIRPFLLVDLAIDQKQFKISQIQVVYSQTVKYTGINRTSDVKNVYTSKLYVYIQIWSP